MEKEYEFRHYATPKPVDESFSKTEGAKMFQNRLNKNKARYSREAKEQGVSCYRMYDSDMPEYAFAIDLYEDTWMVVQEYDPPVTIDPEKAEFRRKEVLAVLQQESGFSKENIFVKTRSKQKGKTQYQSTTPEGELHRIRESSFTFFANFNDYLDTGIFLDHRITRNLLKGLAKGRRFLNLFCYTATATVYAVSGGAVSSVSVDSSQTYLSWAEKNLRANGIKGPEHTLVRSDVIPWLSRERGKYDLVFVDPPTFSNSKSRPKYLSIQQDHEGMLLQIARILSPSGIIIFSTHYRKFKMNIQVLEEIFNLENITDQTIPFDFQRNRRIHQVWKLSLKTNRIKRGINDEDKEEYRTAKTGGTYRRREHSTDNNRRNAGGGGQIRNSLGKKDLRRLDK